MSYALEGGKLTGYSNIAAGSPAGKENHLGRGVAPITPPTYNISVGNPEPKNVEKFIPGVSAPAWHR